MREIPFERFRGRIPVPTAVYRPGNVFGGGDIIPASQLGIGHYSQLAEFEQEATALQAEERSILVAIEGAAGKRTDEQAARLVAIDGRFEGAEGKPGLTAQISAEKRRREREAATPAIPVDAIAEKAQEAAEKAADKPPTPFASLGEQLQAVHAAALAQKSGGQIHPGLMAIQEWWGESAAVHGASSTVGSDGGFLVQTDLSNELLNDIIAAGQLASQASTREIGPGKNGVKFNVIDETSRATGSRYGGVRAYWLAEGGQKTASRPKLRQVEITLQKLAALYVATDELLEDAIALESFVRPLFVEEMSFIVDDAMIRGSGAGLPLGILNADALVTVSKETGQAADTVVLENIDKMLVRLIPGSVPKASWYINQEVWPQLFNLQQVIGLGGVPAFLPPGGAQSSPFGTLRGRPVQVIEQASAIGDLGDIILADWKQYLLIRKGGIQQASSIHVYFDTDETAFRWVLRTNGRPIRHASLTPYKGSGTLSPFVALQAR